MVSKKVFCSLLIYRNIKLLCFHFLSILQESYCTPILFSSFQCPSSGSEVQYAQSYTSMYSLFFCRFREFCTYSMHTVLPVLPPTLTKHTHAGRYSWNRKSVVHQCRIRFHGIPLIPLARVFSQCVSYVSSHTAEIQLCATLYNFRVITQLRIHLVENGFSNRIIILVESMIKPFKQFFSFGCANSNIHIRTENAVRILTV